VVNVVQGETGPVVQIQPGSGTYIDVDSLGLEIIGMNERVFPEGLDDFARATRTDFLDVVVLVRSADMTWLTQSVDQYEANVQAIRQRADDVKVPMANISLGLFSAQEVYNRHTAFIQVIWQAIAEVQLERGVAEPER
jgi:hypothetical protein